MTLAFLVLALTGCDDDDGSTLDNPRKRGSMSPAPRGGGVASLAFLLLALVGCDDDGSTSPHDAPGGRSTMPARCSR